MSPPSIKKPITTSLLLQKLPVELLLVIFDNVCYTKWPSLRFVNSTFATLLAERVLKNINIEYRDLCEISGYQDYRFDEVRQMLLDPRYNSFRDTVKHLYLSAFEFRHDRAPAFDDSESDDDDGDMHQYPSFPPSFLPAATPWLKMLFSNLPNLVKIELQGHRNGLSLSQFGQVVSSIDEWKNGSTDKRVEYVLTGVNYSYFPLMRDANYLEVINPSRSSHTEHEARAVAIMLEQCPNLETLDIGSDVPWSRVMHYFKGDIVSIRTWSLTHFPSSNTSVHSFSTTKLHHDAFRPFRNLQKLDILSSRIVESNFWQCLGQSEVYLVKLAVECITEDLNFYLSMPGVGSHLQNLTLGTCMRHEHIDPNNRVISQFCIVALPNLAKSLRHVNFTDHEHLKHELIPMTMDIIEILDNHPVQLMQLQSMDYTVSLNTLLMPDSLPCQAVLEHALAYPTFAPALTKLTLCLSIEENTTISTRRANRWIKYILDIVRDYKHQCANNHSRTYLRLFIRVGENARHFNFHFYLDANGKWQLEESGQSI